MQDVREVHVVYPISMDVIKPALHLRIARVTVQDDVVRTYIYYSDKIALSPPSGGSLQRRYNNVTPSRDVAKPLIK